MRRQRKGIVGIVPPPARLPVDVWGQDDRFVSTYFSLFTAGCGGLFLVRLGHPGRERLLTSSDAWTT